VPTEPLTITFGDATVADANRFAGSLADTLRDAHPSVIVDRHRGRADTQDAGTILSIVLAAPAAIAVAKGIAGWLARNAGVQIEVRRKGKVVLRATHLDSKDIPRIAEALAKGDGFS